MQRALSGAAVAAAGGGRLCPCEALVEVAAGLGREEQPTRLLLFLVASLGESPACEHSCSSPAGPLSSLPHQLQARNIQLHLHVWTDPSQPYSSNFFLGSAFGR